MGGSYIYAVATLIEVYEYVCTARFTSRFYVMLDEIQK
jgi:hypothetical protein